jgi:glycerol-3-phosphate dehydrogenase (NAD(P)+)
VKKIGIIGAGAWGTALAQCLANAGHGVTIWALEPEVVTSINEQRENTSYFPGISLNEKIQATGDMLHAAKNDIVLLVTPAQFLRHTLKELKGHVDANTPLVICSKGIELGTGDLLSEIAAEEMPDADFAILTGPTFASEVAKGLPCAVTIAAQNKNIAQQICDGLANNRLRPYSTDDVIGAQIGSAVKNVMAIACGIIYGKGLGENARAALITRGLAEIARLAAAMGGKRETLMGLCGIGDLILTCSSMESRNFSFGAALGKGQKMEEILGERKAVTEGVHTAKALMVMAKKYKVDMPIAETVYKCLFENLSVDEAIESMLSRPVRPENQ